MGSLIYPAFQPSNADHHPHEPGCSWNLSSVETSTSFPFIYPIDERTQDDLLKRLFPAIFDNLIRIRSDVCSNMMVTAQEFNEHLANETKIFICSDNECTEIAFRVDIIIAREQLNLMNSKINSLNDVFYDMSQAYHTLPMEELRSKMSALDQAIRRLEQNKLMIQEVERILQDLAFSVFNGKSNSHTESRGGRVTRFNNG